MYAINASGCSSDPSSCATGGLKCESSKCTSIGLPRRLAGEDRHHRRRPAARRRRGHQRLARRRAGALPGRRRRAEDRRHARRGPGLRAQRRRHVLLRLGRTASTTRCRPTRAPSASKTDTPTFPAVGEPAFGTLDGTTTSMFAPTAGLLRALDVVAPDYQKGSQDFIAGWNANSGQFSPGFPAVDNDLSFITGETVGDVTGEAPKQEVARRHGLAGPAGLQRRGRAGEQRLAEAHRRLDGRHADARLAGHDRHRLERQEGRRLDHARRHGLGLHDARLGLLAELVAELPPRHRQLGRLHARRGPARHAAECERRRKRAALHGARATTCCAAQPRATKSSPRKARSRPQNFASATPLPGAPEPAHGGHGADATRCRRTSRPTWRSARSTIRATSACRR